ncbi:MAG: zf-TFIIB domain-containing protein [Candidatus Gastranaerophilales bacterium]|nr:zf-TFIIB domain-containing protein [Candidatus Gastranaerophilales bacterium]
MVDNFKDLKCPACQKKMTKVFMPQAGVNVDICLDGCGGIYFDNRELECFDEQHENIDEITKAVEGKTFIEVDETLPRVCPNCGAKMVKHFASGKKKITIDDCYSCGGKFLDHGELTKIRAEYNTREERDIDTMKMIYDTIGFEMEKLEEKNANSRAHRSSLKKFFDKMLNS